MRFKLNFDLWECDCGAIVAMGKECWQCGKTYADILTTKAKPEPSDRAKKRKSKYRTPAAITGFLTSYCFKTKKN